MSVLLHDWRVSVIAAVCLHALPVAAEVMDKEATIPEVWAWALVGAAAGVLLPSYRWWLIFVSLPLSAFIPLGNVLECHDAVVGPAILREADVSFVLQCHLALGLVLAANIAGLLFFLRRRKAPRIS